MDVSLACLYVSQRTLQALPAIVGRVIYCSRTVPELLKVVQELKDLVKHYEEETGEPAGVLGLALSSRKNLCVHPQVRGRCRASRVIESSLQSVIAWSMTPCLSMHNQTDSCYKRSLLVYPFIRFARTTDHFKLVECVNTVHQTCQ